MNNKWRLLILISFITIITLLHNVVSFEGPLFLNVYQRLYYIPIVMAAYWFGLKGALIASVISTFSYPHHGHYHWPDRPFYTMNQYAEMIMLNIIAVVTGVLSDLETRQRRRYEKTSLELKEAYRKLQDSFEQVRRVDRLSALGELSAAMAHEIRNPLGSIKGGIEIIEDQFNGNDKKKEFIGIVKKEISRLDNTISEFLKYARPREPEKRMGSLHKLTESVIRLVTKKAEQQGVVIEMSPTEEMQDIMMDSEQIRQALLNIVLNAIQAIPEGGSIRIESGISGDQVFVSVRDSGGGIPEQNLEKLFDPFFTTRNEGTGLGLSISYQIIKAHKGHIEVSNVDEGGAEFIITLPIREKNDEE